MPETAIMRELREKIDGEKLTRKKTVNHMIEYLYEAELERRKIKQ